MNDEKFKDTLQACFNGDKGAYNKCMYEYQHRRIKELEQINEEHRKINGQLRSNWDRLRELIEQYLENEKYSYLSDNPKDRCRYDIFMEIKDKMNELEGKDKE